MASITSVLAGLPSMGFGIGLSPQVGIALALTLVGSLSTALGGALVVLQAVPDIKRLGLLQGFASGLMLSLTFFDLVPEAIDAIGFPAANLWFFAGALLFATVVHFVPEPSLAPEPSVAPGPSSEPLLQYSSDPVSESTPEPASQPTPDSDPNRASGLPRAGSAEHPNLVRGSGSDSERDSRVERWLSGIKSSEWDSRDGVGSGNTDGAHVGEGGGRGVEGEGGDRRRLKGGTVARGARDGNREKMIFDSFQIPRGENMEQGKGVWSRGEREQRERGLAGREERDGGVAEREVGEREMQRRRQAVLWSGVITALGISLHNFPEGIAVFLGSMKGLRVGISLAVAIALHNIPEGLAVALPIYFGTRSRWAAFRAAALSGAAEPLGVIFVALFFPASLAPDIIEGLLAGVGGIMAFLVLHEMLPLAFEYAGHRRAVQAMFLGMAVMSANLHLLALSLPPDISL
ncbi:unnamed protein product [Closterium sp. NIES-65]|nr:unnamed protein product [Closterium sp. NIES-65]